MTVFVIGRRRGRGEKNDNSRGLDNNILGAILFDESFSSCQILCLFLAINLLRHTIDIVPTERVN